MKIKFDVGTQQNVDTELVKTVLDNIIHIHTQDGSNSGKMCIYLNFFDENGINYDITKDGLIIDYIVRSTPYLRKYRDKKPIMTVTKNNVEVATVYECYSKIK